METEKKPRQQLSKVTENTIAPSRVRNFIDGAGFNQKVEQEVDKIKEKIEKIKKEGGPQAPIAVTSLKRDATEEQKKKHKELVAKHNEQKEKYDDYVSEKFNRLNVIYLLCKQLNKIHALLLKKKRNTLQDKELEDLRNIVHDKPAAKKSKEKEEEYKTRLEKFVPHGFSKHLGETDLMNADSVQSLINKLKEEYSEVSLFLKKNEVSKTRIRFNDPAAVALTTALEVGLEELLEYGMRKTLEARMKTIQPDFMVSPDLENCEWYVLFRNLPHLKAVIERQKRKAQYTADKAKERLKFVQKIKNKAKKNAGLPKKEGQKREKFTYPTFQEVEVKNGFAEKREENVKDSEGVETTRTYYVWYGIEIDKEDRGIKTNFNHYIQQICQGIIKRLIDNGESDFNFVKISTNIRKFGSDLIIDFIHRLSPQIKVLITAMGVKTVDEDVVKTALRMIVLENYHSSDGIVVMNEEHERLFGLIDKKVELCTKHQTGRVAKPELEESSEEGKKGYTKDPTVTKKEAEKEMEEEFDGLEEEETVQNNGVKKEEPKPKPAAAKKLAKPIKN